MTHIKFKILLASGTEPLKSEVGESVAGLSFDFGLQAGTHTVSTPFVPSPHKELQVALQLSFTYQYDPEHHMVTISSAIFAPDVAMHIIMMRPDGSIYIPTEKTDAAEELLLNQDNLYSAVITKAEHMLIEELRRVEGLTVRVRTPPPPISKALENQLLLVYKRQQFAGLYDPQIDYGLDYTVRSVKSVWGGVVYFSASQYFANVIGSTWDPKINGSSWLKLWEASFGPAAICTSYKYAGNYPHGAFPCSCNNRECLVGGHIVQGQRSEEVVPGSDDVYIMPICKAHNNNDSIYMQAIETQSAVWLKDYMH